MKTDFYRSRKAGGILILSAGIFSFAFCETRQALASEASSTQKGPNVKIDTADLGLISLNEKTEPKEKRPVFYADGNTSLDINEDGDPNINMRF